MDWHQNELWRMDIIIPFAKRNKKKTSTMKARRYPGFLIPAPALYPEGSKVRTIENHTLQNYCTQTCTKLLLD